MENSGDEYDVVVYVLETSWLETARKVLGTPALAAEGLQLRLTVGRSAIDRLRAAGLPVSVLRVHGTKEPPRMAPPVYRQPGSYREWGVIVSMAIAPAAATRALSEIAGLTIEVKNDENAFRIRTADGMLQEEFREAVRGKLPPGTQFWADPAFDAEQW